MPGLGPCLANIERIALALALVSPQTFLIHRFKSSGSIAATRKGIDKFVDSPDTAQRLQEW